MPRVDLYPHQKEALAKIRNGSILCGGVGSGKSITSLAYYFTKVLGGSIGDDGVLCFGRKSIDICIITTARKRDTLEWDKECLRFFLSKDRNTNFNHIGVTIDSWNNIGKYENVKDAFFLFDEQRVVGSGAWSKHFLKIAKSNQWILLSATPGDVWMDYAPVFIANGFFKNRTEFVKKHVIYSRFSKYPKIDRYIDTDKLESLRSTILVNMDYKRPATPHYSDVVVPFSEEQYKIANVNRWNASEGRPIRDAGELCYILRRIVNSDQRRLKSVVKLLKEHKKLIVFYNFDYELALLKTLSSIVAISEWNGHRHETIPRTDSWLYLVQYTAGAEGWNCIETNAMVFFSQNYSYKIMTQSAGRIDRMNTPFKDLFYYTLTSNSTIDMSIARALKSKKTFNEKAFAEESFEY